MVKTNVRSKNKQEYENPSEYLNVYRALAKEQADIWRHQEGELSEKKFLDVERRHLDLILMAPEILTTPEQRAEEDYLRQNMINARAEMVMITIAEESRDLHRNPKEY